MTPTELERFIADYTDEAWNRGNVDAMRGYYAADYEHHDGARPDVTTLADYMQWARDLLGAFSGFHVSADDLIAARDRAVKRWTASGTHTGAVAGIAPTGRPVTFSGISVYRFADGRIVEGWYAYDMLGLLQQLGALPAPEPAAA